MCNREFMRLRCVIMRGGTSKAVFFMENELPKDPVQRDKIILAVFGSPDSRQIDGLGGADTLTSKVAIISPSSRDDADIDYHFGQVAIHDSFIDYSGNCGNISSAVGPFAIEEGLVKAIEPVTYVRIHNINTQKIYVSEVPVYNGKPRVLGNFRIAGVPGTGAEIVMDMAGTAGTVNGKLLPTGNRKDKIKVDGLGEITVSIVDAANPMIFVNAQEIGVSGTESASQIDGNKDLLKLLESIRSIGAEMIGLVTHSKEATEKSPALPMVAFVAPPKDYINHLTGQAISADSYDLLSRVMWMQVTHKTYSGTATVATGAAAVIPGTIVNEIIGHRKDPKIIKIGHPGGIIPIEVQAEVCAGKVVVTRAAISRTARRLMEGYAYVPGDVLS